MDRILYVSDLDGTLLNENQEVSPYTARVINRMVETGGLFSYATARSFVTASKATAGVTARLIRRWGIFPYANTSSAQAATVSALSATSFREMARPSSLTAASG